MRHASVGYGVYEKREKDTVQIAETAVQGARSNLDRDPDFAFVFASPQINVESLVAALDDRLDCEWVGCTTANEVCNVGQLDGSCVVLMVASDDITLRSTVIEDIREDPVEKAAEAAAELQPVDVFIPLVPGFTEKTPSVDFPVLKGILNEVGTDIPVVGAAAGDEHQYRQTHQFRNGQVFEDALVLTALSTKKEVDLGLDHGYQPTEHVYMPEVEGNNVVKLNGKRAQDVYADDIGVAPEELEGIVESPTGAIVPKLLAHYAHRHPFGVAVGDEYVLKVPETVTEDGEIVFSCEIPESTNLVLMTNEDTDLEEGAMDSLSDWIADDRSVAFGLVFECAGRTLALQEKKLDEVEEICNMINGPFAGFFSYGEIGGLKKDMCTANFLTISSLIIYDD